MPSDLKTYQFKSAAPGPHLLVFGAIHGDEACGPLAIEQCAKLIREDWVALKAGCLTMIPVCNRNAFDQRKRFTEKNLNRVFKKHAVPLSYEERLANRLTVFVESCDYLLDLHSQSSPGKPFIFQDYEDSRTDAFARALGVETAIKGWPEMFESMADLNAGDTVGYAHEKGKTSVLVECGQHKDPRAPGVAHMAIINALIHLDMIEAPDVPVAHPYQTIRGTTIVTVPEEGGHLVKEWKHLQDVSKGQLLAVSGTGRQQITAPYDGVIILPKYAARPKEEWFYIGKREPS